MRKAIVAVAGALFAVSAVAQIKITREKSGHHYGYGEGFAQPHQAWNGTPFVAEADLEVPRPNFRNAAWFGVWVDDRPHRERYILGLVNTSGKTDPEELQWGVIMYPRKGFNRTLSKDRWATAAKKVTVRVAFDGRRLSLQRPDGQGGFVEACSVETKEGFAPTQLGVNAETYDGTGSIIDFKAHAWRMISGKGPAKSDPLDGTAPVKWNLGPNWTSKYVEYPHPLLLEWSVAPEEPMAFFRGEDAVLKLRAKTWAYGGRELCAKWTCTDRAGRVVATGEEKAELVRREDVFVAIRVPAAALARNDVYRITVRPSVADRTPPELMAQFAVLPPREMRPFSFDEASPYTINYLMGGSWKLSGMIGAKSLRMTYWNEKAFDSDYQLRTDKAREYGILLNGPLLMVHQRDNAAEVEAEAHRIARVFDRLNRRYPDLVRIQEVYNEPESHHGRSELIGFCSMFKRIKEELRRLGSPVKLMGTGPLHCDLDYLMRVAVTGGRDAVDMVCTHGYRSPCRPEFGYEEDIRAIKAIYGTNDYPIVCNEDTYFTYVDGERTTADDGEVTMTSPTHTLNEVDELTQGVYIQRKFLNQLMAGYTGVNQFNAIDNHTIAYKSDYLRPGVVNYAAITWLMAHPKFVRRLTPATDSLWALEWKSDGDVIRTFWAMDGLHEVTVRGRDLRVYDTFANEIAAGDEVTFVAGVAPVYVKGAKAAIAKRAPTDRLPAVVLSEETPLSAAPFDAEILGHATGMKSAVVEVTVRNNSGKDDTFAVRPVFIGKDAAAWGFEPKERTAALKAGETRVFSFTPVSHDAEKPFDPTNPGVNYTALWWTEGYQIGARVTAGGEARSFFKKRMLGLRGIPRLEEATVDAEGAEWESVPWFRQLGNRRRNAGLGNFGWYGRESFLPEFKFAWSSKGLRFYAKVLDERHDATQKGLDAWRTDSVQIGLTGHWRKPDHVNWPLLTLSLANKEVYLQRDTPKLKAGPLKEIEFATKRVEGSYETTGTTYYEALIPWSVLDMDPQTTKTFGYSIIFNQSIGFWRQGWEGYFAPLGGQIVDPTYFGDLTLCD